MVGAKNLLDSNLGDPDKAGIRVIKDSGRPLTPAESIGRNLMRIVDWMPFFYAIGIASAFLKATSG